MSSPDPSIPIAQRYHQLFEKWEEFSKQPEARICCWQIEHDELQMIDAFFKAETSVYGQTRDIFFKLITPFKSIETFQVELINELKEQIEDYQKANPDIDLDIQWQPSVYINGKSNTDHSLTNFAEFTESLDFKSCTVAYLYPEIIHSRKTWTKWLEETLINQGVQELKNWSSWFQYSVDTMSLPPHRDERQGAGCWRRAGCWWHRPDRCRASTGRWCPRRHATAPNRRSRPSPQMSWSPPP